MQRYSVQLDVNEIKHFGKEYNQNFFYTHNKITLLYNTVLYYIYLLLYNILLYYLKLL